MVEVNNSELSREYRILVIYQIQVTLSNFKRGGYTRGYHFFIEDYGNNTLTVTALLLCIIDQGMVSASPGRRSTGRRLSPDLYGDSFSIPIYRILRYVIYPLLVCINEKS